MGFFYTPINVGDWTDITLQSGWTGTLQFRTTAITCRLRGTISPPGIIIGNTFVGTLPVGARPEVQMQYTIAMGIGSANFTINIDGTVVYSGITTGLSAMNMASISFFIV